MRPGEDGVRLRLDGPVCQPFPRFSNMEKGVPIRAITRGLAVLQAVNQHGSLTMMEIAQTSRVPYPTACRIVQTLLHEGMLEREPGRKTYRATPLVLTLASGTMGGVSDLSGRHATRGTVTHLNGAGGPPGVTAAQTPGQLRAAGT